MNKKIIVLSLVVGFLVAGVVMPSGRVLAQTTDPAIQDLQAQIQALLDKIKVLQAQLAATQAGGQAWCYTFNTNLKIGDQNDDVTNLDTALVKEGLLSQDVFQDGRTALNFDEMTASAVSGFQEKYRSEILTPNGLKSGTGYVGPSTRKKLNQLYGCGGNIILPQPQAIKIISPNGGETLKIGQTYEIKWNPGAYPSDTRVGISLNDTRYDYFSESPLGSVGIVSTQNTGNYSWKVPAELVDGLGRVMKLGSGNVYKISAAVSRIGGECISGKCDYSDAPFSIVSGGSSPANITVLSPNESWMIGETKKIVWQYSPELIQLIKDKKITSVMIGLKPELGVTGGGMITRVDATLIGGDVVRNWDTSNLLSFTSYSWKVGDVSCYPGGGCQGPNGDPVVLPGYHIIVVSAGEPPTPGTYTGKSGPFNIVSSVSTAGITVVAPNGGERWMLNSSVFITWTPDPESNFVEAYLEKKQGDQFVTVGKVVKAGKGSIQWYPGEIDRAPWTAMPGDGYYIRLVNTQTGATDRSDNPFTLLPADYIKVDLKIDGSDNPISVPTGGRNVKLTWTSVNADSCNFLPSDLGDAINGLPPSGERTVFLKENKNNWDYAVAMICSSPAGSRSDYVNVSRNTASFPGITITSPNGGEVMPLGSGQVIMWNATGLANGQLARIDLYQRNESTWIRNIATNYLAELGSYNWLIPSDIGQCASGCVLKISTFLPPVVEDWSNAPFSIVSGGSSPANITVLSPNGGEEWAVGSAQTIKWTTSNYPPNVPVNIHLLKRTVVNNLNVYDIAAVIALDTLNDGSEVWNIPTNISSGSDYFIQVGCPSGYSFPGGCGGHIMSNAPFSIVTGSTSQKSITVAFPNGGEKLQIGQPIFISWTSSSDLVGTAYTSYALTNANIVIDLLKIVNGQPGYSFVKRLSQSNRNFGIETIIFGSDIAPGDNYVIGVGYLNLVSGIGEAYDNSDGVFSILSAPQSPPPASNPPAAN